VWAVTRADLLRCAYEDLLTRPTFAASEDREFGEPAVRNVSNLLANHLPGRVQTLLRTAGAVADDVGTRIYAVGGFVRDLLLRHENLDVDLVVEGDGIAFAERLSGRLSAKVTSHRKFGTAVLTLPTASRWTWPRPAPSTTSTPRPCPRSSTARSRWTSTAGTSR